MSAPAFAQASLDLKECLGLPDTSARLACYDRLAGREAMVTLPASPAAVPGTPEAVPVSQAATPATTQQSESSFMSRYWELDQADKRGTFNYTSYRPNFFMPLHSMASVNRNPSSPTRAKASNLPRYQNGEAKIQVSLRSKVWENALLPGADLWVAYTQQSMWQLWNRDQSAPFRSTDYQPEVIYVVPTPASWQSLPLGWKWRMTQAGIVHQSNGQPDPLSRSWNRVYAQAGLERRDLMFNLRLEHRLKTDNSVGDDNPDIQDYMKRAELQMMWTPGRSTAAVAWRPSFSGKGSVQLDYSYPVFRDRPDGLRWYAQLFQGYGETLLDYNFKQTSLSLGLTIFKF
ncbi:phospholipase A [Aquabacterium sp.]|uniref:phospholipase A n=1 Tax=Aquabacterium sp. TaxID=1872578 RepID=UPI002487B1F6|nr:phospholipase A [Aquabacterium sp.]MDI1260397.1 phospholipase A [Aquabacterium sp.]